MLKVSFVYTWRSFQQRTRNGSQAGVIITYPCIRLHMSRISLGSVLVKNREERIQRSSKPTETCLRETLLI